MHFLIGAEAGREDKRAALAFLEEKEALLAFYLGHETREIGRSCHGAAHVERFDEGSFDFAVLMGELPAIIAPWKRLKAAKCAHSHEGAVFARVPLGIGCHVRLRAAERGRWPREKERRKRSAPDSPR
ncbi:MAG: hypothetical protein AAF762_01290 [Pseudomonadota bacterium]